MEEIEIIEEKTLYKTKYILFDTIEEWQNVVNQINIIRNYPNEVIDTNTYMDVPIMSIDNKFVLPILADLQEFNSELFATYTLVETFEQQINENIS